MSFFRESDLEGLHLYVVASGVGSKVQNELWMTPGTSSFLVGASFPYSTDDTNEFLGFKPDSYCSREEALQLAMEAFMRAKRHGLSGSGKSPGRAVGVAITGAVASIKGAPRRGEHRFHVALVDDHGALHELVTLPKDSGEAARKLDDGAAGVVFQRMITRAQAEPLDIEREVVVPDQELRGTFFKHPYFSQSGARFPEVQDVSTFFPGSFSPLHEGHQLMAAETEEHGDPVAYMICADSVHKRPLSVPEMLSRAAQFRLERLDGHCGRVLFTQGDPLFVDKFKAHPQSKFLMGVDTFIRMLDPKWGPARAEVLEAIERYEIHVQVSDRVQEGITTRAADAIRQLVPLLQHRSFDVLDQLPPDVSSTELRQQRVC